MPLDNVAVGEVLTADLTNALIDYMNSPRIAVLTTSGFWSVPPGAQTFRVSCWGGGGRGSSVYVQTEPSVIWGYRGRDGGSCSFVYTGVAIGTSFSCTIGAGGNSSTPKGGTTSFGASQSAEGGWGYNAFGALDGAATPPTCIAGGIATPWQPLVAPWMDNNGGHVDLMTRKGQGGYGRNEVTDAAGDGGGGIIIIEW